jgi:hypothetical protein
MGISARISFFRAEVGGHPCTIGSSSDEALTISAPPSAPPGPK